MRAPLHCIELCNACAMSYLLEYNVSLRPPSFQHFPKWNWEEREFTVGSTALAAAIFVGADKRPTIDALVKVGAKLGYLCDNGSTVLTNMAANVVSKGYTPPGTVVDPHSAHASPSRLLS